VPGVREYACLVIEVSEAGKRLLAEIVGDRLNGPKVLYDARAAGQISDGDLRVLIPDTWLYVDWPERIIGAGNWVRLFRVAGFLSIPYGLPRPDSAITVFRGATAERRGRDVVDHGHRPGRPVPPAAFLACADGRLPGRGHA
jgi:hypothetical protein